MYNKKITPNARFAEALPVNCWAKVLSNSIPLN
jgi:hypothetical protein